MSTLSEPPARDLHPPRPLAAGALRVVPLGGLGAIGRNMTVFEYDGALLVVDCGVLFPESDQPGIDLILPDFSHIEDRLDDIVAVVLTHGHEDHIGALPYLLRLRADLPLVGSRLTLALIEAKLREHRIKPVTDLVAEEELRTYGPFECEFIAVNHSIPDALAVAIRTPAGLAVHTGDFKMDQVPLDGRLTDLGTFARLAEEGIDLLLSDSTNAEIPGFVTAERDIGPVLDDVIGRAQQRVIVACFASHVHRVQQVLDSAARHSRKVTFVGRSMVRNMGVARDLGLLHIPSDLMVAMDEAAKLPPERVVFISTGSQGEPLSALSRMAGGSHHQVNVVAGDTVILASSMIPGNETEIFKIINKLSRVGVAVIYKDVAKVHVSGHAPAGELTLLLNIAKPRNLLPVHGEWRHLRAHGKIAERCGIPADRILLIEDGVTVDLRDGRAVVSGRVPCGHVYVDGNAVGDVGDEALQHRRILGEEGFVAVTLVVEFTTGTIVRPIDVSARGFSDDPDAFAAVVPLLETEVKNALTREGTDQHRLSQVVRRSVGKWVSDNYRRKPMIIPTVLEV